MEERASGIILRTRPFTETSLIVQWLTVDRGRISTVAKGARRPKSPFAGKLDLYYEADFSFQPSRRSELHTLRELVVTKSHVRLREEMGWLHQAYYFGLLIEKATETETPIPELHHLLQAALEFLPSHPPNPATVLVFELKLLPILGYAPDGAAAPAAIREIITTSAEMEFGELAATIFGNAAEVKRSLNRQLKQLVGTALEQVPPQRDKALKLGAA
jgi:DNA repair protein RecO (recombination protein O)